MRILIITTFFPPLNSIASLRPYTWAKYWSQAGHDVTVLTSEKSEDEKTALNLPTEGFRIIECPGSKILKILKNRNAPEGSGKGHAPGLIKQFIHFLRFKKGIFNAARMPDFSDIWAFYAWNKIKKEGKWDLVISTAGPYSVHLIAYMLKRKGLCKKWTADYRDTWSNNYIYPGLFPFNTIEKWLERHLLKYADMAVTISEPFARSFRQLYPFLRVHTIENGFDPEDVKVSSEETIFPKEDKFRIVHTGSIYLGKRDPTPLFQALNRLKDHPLLDKLEIIFVGPRQSNLEELIERYQVGKWVKIHGFVSRNIALQMQREAHALLFLAWNDPLVDGVLTGKIFEYLYACTPIIAVGASQMEASQKLILEARAGYVLNQVQNIEKYLIDNLSTCRKELLNYNHDVINRFDRKTLAHKLLELAR